MGFKLMLQRARAPRPAHQLPPTLASSGPDVGRPGHLAGPARDARDRSGRPKGESQQDDQPPLDSSLTPTYSALVPSERLCPQDRGTPTRSQTKTKTSLRDAECFSVRTGILLAACAPKNLKGL